MKSVHEPSSCYSPRGDDDASDVRGEGVVSDYFAAATVVISDC